MSQILTRAAIVAALLCPVALPLAVRAADAIPAPGAVPTVPEGGSTLPPATVARRY